LASEFVAKLFRPLSRSGSPRSVSRISAIAGFLRGQRIESYSDYEQICEYGKTKTTQPIWQSAASPSSVRALRKVGTIGCTRGSILKIPKYLKNDIAALYRDPLQIISRI
jgi:hypothetical protein